MILLFRRPLLIRIHNPCVLALWNPLAETFLADEGIMEVMYL